MNNEQDKDGNNIIKFPKLRSPNEFRRPDVKGNLRHIVILTDLDKPISELDVDDIMQINWQGAMTAIRDSIIRIDSEGDLFSSTLQETMALLAFVLKRLEYEDAEYQKKLLDCLPPEGFMEWLMVFLPGTIGSRFRSDLRMRIYAKKKSRALGKIREELFALRTKIGEAVDKSIHRYLVFADADYRALDEKYEALSKSIEQCARIICELERYEYIGRRDYLLNLKLSNERNQMESRFLSHVNFLDSAIGATYNGRRYVIDGSALLGSSRKILSRLHSQEEPLRCAMGAARDKMKQQIYSGTKPK